MRTKQKAPGGKRRSGAKTKQVQQARTAAPRKRPAEPKFTAKARYELIEKAAYLRAEQRGFESGHELEDWLAAEAEVQKLVRAGRVPVIQGRQ
jgi:hypothetical protein